MASILSLTSQCYVPGVTAVNTAIFEIIAGPSTRPKILEIILDFNSGTTATPPAIAVGQSANAGSPAFSLTAINLSNPLIPNPSPEDTGISGPNNYIQILTVGQWASLPTQPTQFFRRITPISTASTVVNPSYYFEFPLGLAIAPSNSVSVWLTNQTAHATAYYWDINVIVEC